MGFVVLVGGGAQKESPLEWMQETMYNIIILDIHMT